jgi:hypothetical protein
LVAHRTGHGEQLFMDRPEFGQRRCHDAAVHVAARAQRVQQTAVDRLDRGLQVLLHDAVELEGLASGQPECAIRAGPGQLVEPQPLVRPAHASRESCPDHERPRRFEHLATSLVAQVTVVLEIDAVELRDLLVIARDCAGDRIGEPVQQTSAQAVAAGLDGLVGVQLLDRLRAVPAAVDARA